MYRAYKLNKQGDSIQPWRTPFLIWNQSVVPSPVLTLASWPAYRFLKRQVRWSNRWHSHTLFPDYQITQYWYFLLLTKNGAQLLCQYFLLTLSPIFISHIERVTGRKARGPQAAGGNKLQVASVFFFFFLYTKPVLIMSWQHLILPWVNQWGFFMLMKLCICFGICLSSKWFRLGLTFFFSNLGLIIAQQTSIPVSCFMAGGWHALCHPISKERVVGEGS